MNKRGEADEERFDEVIADYLDARATGKPVDEGELLATYPEFADELEKFFADHRRMGGLLEVASHDTLPSGKTRGAGDTPTIANLDSVASQDLRASYGVDPEKCIADYLLLEKVAEGGMGVVYKAKQLALNRIVAFKMIRAGEFADAEEIRRFRVEAEAAAKLTHPGIVPIYQIGEDKGQHFFSMALVDGPSLAEMIREEAMKPRRAAEYVSKVARAVHYAHEQGIIHRDIKPANVLVDSNNQPKVTDFGLAKQITSDHELTMSGQILGTASYMSPEQAAGHEITPLADVYSIGALLYALITKQPPFTGANPVDILLDVLSKEPATPSSLNVSVSRDLETICMRCLDKDPHRRYESAAAVADDLDRFLDGTPILARPVGRIEKTIRWCQRRPAIATVIFLSVMLCFAAIAYYAKEGETRYAIDQRAVALGERRSLAEQARNYYALHPPRAASKREELYVLAGNAMLAYHQQDQSTSDDVERLFFELTVALQAAHGADPSDAQLKSALADCLMQLARFRPSGKHGKGMGGSLVGVVSAADASKVRSWLQQASELLMELHAEHPDNKLLADRAAAARAAMEHLPGSFQERTEHLMAAAKLSKDWDATRGVVRFGLDEVPRFAMNAEEIESLEAAKSSPSPSDALRLARVYRESGQRVAATSQLRYALSRGTLTPLELQCAFADLALLAAHEPGAVAMALEKQWPLTPEGFYRAILGIRQAM